MTAQDVIRFDCGSCGKTLKVPSSKAGKKGACPGCKEPIRVPEPEMELELAEPETNWIDDLPPAQPSENTARPKNQAAAQEVGWKEVLSSDVWVGVGLIGPLFVWALFVVFALTGIDLLGSSDNSADAPKMTTMGMLYMALGFSVVCFPIGFYRYHRAKRILGSGVEVDYEIRKFSGVRQGMTDATVEYSVGGKTYKKKVTVTEEQAEEGFALIVDPDKPKRVITRPLDA